MEYVGTIRKMRAEDQGGIQYHLPVGESLVGMNQFIGKDLELNYRGSIHCIRCGNRTSKSFAQGYCYPCFSTAPETEECVLRPELCRAHEGISRDMDYAKSHCLIEQVVYLSLTSGIKVGVTRSTQVPVRWIDQGAVEAIEFARTPNRYLAGLMEVSMKQHLSDKTNWRRMLTEAHPGAVDLVAEKQRFAALLPTEFKEYLSDDQNVWKLHFPVLVYPEKVSSLNFDKTPQLGGKLMGIKGQYLIFEGNKVLNIRKFGGYELQLKA